MENNLIVTGLCIFIFMNCMYFLALRLKDNSIVDIGWGIGFILIALATIFNNGNFYQRQMLITLLIAVWGLRLAIYIFIRNRGRGEDFRYKQWREEWGNTIYWRSYLQVFMLQGVIMFMIALPVIQINSSAFSEFGITDYVGLLIWVIGFLFEAAGDAQMMRFKNNINNKGKIMRTGLWKYTRHPNYFGEAFLWWGVFIIAIPAGNIFLSLISPVLITFLLLKVSGVTMLEKKYTGNAEYDEYIRTTSSFIPLPPRK